MNGKSEGVWQEAVMSCLEVLRVLGAAMFLSNASHTRYRLFKVA